MMVKILLEKNGMKNNVIGVVVIIAKVDNAILYIVTIVEVSI